MAKIIKKRLPDNMMGDIQQAAQRLRKYPTNTRCSTCGETAFASLYNFCPYCGETFEKTDDGEKIVVEEELTEEELRDYFFECMEQVAHELGFKFEFKKPEEVDLNAMASRA